MDDQRSNERRKKIDMRKRRVLFVNGWLILLSGPLFLAMVIDEAVRQGRVPHPIFIGGVGCIICGLIAIHYSKQR